MEAAASPDNDTMVNGLEADRTDKQEIATGINAKKNLMTPQPHGTCGEYTTNRVLKEL